jgi:SRSO17 transposase
MIQKAIEEKVPFGWVTGDSIYGGDRRLRRWLEEQEGSFVLAVPKNEPLWYAGFKHGPLVRSPVKSSPKAGSAYRPEKGLKDHVSMIGQ